MCIVSAVHDYGRGLPPTTWQQGTAWPAFQQVIEAAKTFDVIADQPDCEDPGKTAWAKDIAAKTETKKPKTTTAKRKLVDTLYAELERTLGAENRIDILSLLANLVGDN